MANPASSAPPTIDRVDAPDINARAHIATASPGISVSGRSAVNQYSGDRATSTVDHSASDDRDSSRRRKISSAGRATAPPRALSTARPRAEAASKPAARTAAVETLASAIYTG